MSYSRALQSLGTYMLIDDNSEYALDLKLLAIAICRRMVIIHGNKHKAELARALCSLLQSGTTTLLKYTTADVLIQMANECIKLLRELTDKNHLFYAQKLISVLWVKAKMLDKANHDTEAITILQEAAGLAEQITQDSKMCATALGRLSDQFRRLAMHSDAVRIGTQALTTYHGGTTFRALRYLYLSQDLQELRHRKESVDAAQKSVILYRCLAIREPKKWTGHLILSLSNQAHCLAAFDDEPAALLVWGESVALLDKFLDNNLDVELTCTDILLKTMPKHQSIGNIVNDEEAFLKVFSTTIRHLRRLSGIYVQNAKVISTLLQIECDFVCNMVCMGFPQDAQEHIDQWLGMWSNDPETVGWHAIMKVIKGDILDALGHTEQALMTTRGVHRILKQISSSYQPACHWEIIVCMIQEALLQVDLRHDDEALQVAEEALQLSHDNEADGIVRSLHGVACAALSCQNYKRAVEAAQEGCKLSAGPNWQWGDPSLRPILFAILSFAEANLGKCGTPVESAQHAVELSLDLRDMKAHVSRAMAEQSYMETRGNLADILVSTGDVAQARQICEERKVYFIKRVETRMGEYRDLAPILRMLGILCCSDGRHEEGDAAARELARILKTLGSAFPSLQEQVKIRLRHQTKVPILKVLNEMSKKLECTHQAGVLALFEI